MQGLDHTALIAEKKHSINFTVTRKRSCLSLNYNGSNSYLFVNSIEISDIAATPLCLEKV